jgi:hypothetical protein
VFHPKIPSMAFPPPPPYWIWSTIFVNFCDFVWYFSLMNCLYIFKCLNSVTIDSKNSIQLHSSILSDAFYKLW